MGHVHIITTDISSVDIIGMDGRRFHEIFTIHYTTAVRISLLCRIAILNVLKCVGKATQAFV